MTFKRITPIILAGGSGTRLWPLSRKDLPKQFCRIRGERSLFQKTLDRVSHTEMFEPAIVVCSELHQSILATQMPENRNKVASIIVEPEGRDTAAAIALALQTARGEGSDLFLVLPSDHEIEDIEAFHTTIRKAAPAVTDHGRIVTLGVEPVKAETGFGYIRSGKSLGETASYEVLEFIEKPSAEAAEILVQEKNIFWNAGLFFFSAETMKREFKQYAIGIYNDVARAVAMGKWQGKTFSPDPVEFSQVNSLSIDYAVMEKTDCAGVAPLLSDWSDMGTWNAVWNSSPKNSSENVLSGKVYAEDANGNYVHSDGPVVGIAGLDNVVVVANNDAVMVTRREDGQSVKRLVEAMKHDQNKVVDSHSGEVRPWGRFDSLHKGEGHQVKRIEVNPGGQLSLQYHFHRSEHWIVVRGIATVTVDENVSQLAPGQRIFIPQGAVHRLENFTNEPVEIIEVQYGIYLGEDDIVRVEDVYNRAETETVLQ